ncbi:hypothetical protein, partial [Rhizobium ruizarguesonis]
RNQSPVTATRQPEFDHIRCPRLSETLVRDFLKPLSQFSEIRTLSAISTKPFLGEWSKARELFQAPKAELEGHSTTFLPKDCVDCV